MCHSKRSKNNSRAGPILDWVAWRSMSFWGSTSWNTLDAQEHEGSIVCSGTWFGYARMGKNITTHGIGYKDLHSQCQSLFSDN